VLQLDFMKAITNKENWLIEPPGFGETRLNGLKGVLQNGFFISGRKMNSIYGLENRKQGPLQAFKPAPSAMRRRPTIIFNAPWNSIFPKIIYLHPQFEEFELELKEDVSLFFDKVKQQTEEMYGFCADVDQNIPLPIDAFTLSPSKSACSFCNFQELCFSKKGFPAASGKRVLIRIILQVSR